MNRNCHSRTQTCVGRGRGGMLSAVIDSRTAAQVEQLIRDVAAEHVLPYFGRLTAADIVEKGPGDLVTIADRSAEAALTEALTALVPGTVVVGEEAVAGDPGVLARLAGPDPVWVIDPVDGTHNFAAGNPRFTTLVTLARGGELLASWTYAPVLGVMATAGPGPGGLCGRGAAAGRRRPRTGCGTWMSAYPSRTGGRTTSGPDCSPCAASRFDCPIWTLPGWSTSSWPPGAVRPWW